MSLGDHDHCGNTTAQVEFSKVASWWKMPSTYYVVEQTLPTGGRLMIGTALGQNVELLIIF